MVRSSLMDSETDDLSARLRAGTQTLHLEAERSGYVQEILKRRASRTGYTVFLRNLLPAYQALERGLGHHADQEAFRSFDWPPLFRSQAIAEDLQALSGGEGIESIPLLPEGEAYARRIDRAGKEDPIRLIGHGYVRYIGDLSGGQIVKKLLSASPGLEPSMLGFYDFPGIVDADIYKNGFRALLDRAGGITAHADAIVDEAREAFRLNIDLSKGVLNSIQGA